MYKFLIACAILAGAIVLASCGPAAAPDSATVAAPGGVYTDISPATLKEMLANKDWSLINVHIPYEGELSQTDAFIPYDQVEQNLSRFPQAKDSKIVLYCRSGHMSGIAAEKLVKLGYTNVWNLKGGMVAWESAGYPLIMSKR